MEYSAPIGGKTIRTFFLIFLLYIFLGGTIFGLYFCFKGKNIRNSGVLLSSIIGMILIITLPWEDILAGFAVYRGEASLIVRYGYQISFAGVLIALIGIPFSYYLQKGRKAQSQRKVF